jgi:thioredoxin reductase (NADPH)
MYDIVIVGAGPAGLSAAITARARNKEVLVVSNKPQDNPLAKSKLVDNYPGVPGVTGLTLLERMVAHAHDAGALFTYARVISVLSMGSAETPRFSVTTSDDVIDARTVILATGTQSAQPFPGEQEYLGRGVSYCATCDGMLYRTATVCVAALSPEAAEEADFLATLGATVHYLAKSAPSGLTSGIYTHEGTIKAIEGDALGVTNVQFTEKIGQQTKDVSIPCVGVFILRPSIAPDALVLGLELKDGFIVTNTQGRTNIPGVFAAGDCTGKPLQVAKAVGDGQKACFAAIALLDQ